MRVTADSLNRLLGLAGESLVESRWLQPFAQSLLRLKRLHHESGKALDRLRSTLSAHPVDEQVEAALSEAERRTDECEELLGQRLHDLDIFDRRSINLSNRLYEEDWPAG